MVLNKLADWLKGIILSQLVFGALEMSKFFGATNGLLIFYRLQQINDTLGMITDWLWWLNFIALTTGIFWRWFRDKYYRLTNGRGS